MLRLAVLFLGLSKFILCQDISNAEDIRVLSELPLDKLLTLNRGFSEEKEDSESKTESDLESRTIPYALALQNKSKLKDRGGHGGDHYYYEEYEDKGGKSKKIQSIFQISVTSLAFLAFGGYLLCLLIHAIKGKQNNTNINPVMMQTFASYVASNIRKIKNKKRPRNRRKNLNVKKRPNGNKQVQKRPNLNLQKPNANQQPQKKPNGIRNSYVYGEYPIPMRPRTKRDIYESGGFLVTNDYLYNALVDLSEVYTKYNTFDYLKYNETGKYNY